MKNKVKRILIALLFFALFAGISNSQTTIKSEAKPLIKQDTIDYKKVPCREYVGGIYTKHLNDIYFMKMALLIHFLVIRPFGNDGRQQTIHKPLILRHPERIPYPESMEHDLNFKNGNRDDNLL